MYIKYGTEKDHAIAVDGLMALHILPTTQLKH